MKEILSAAILALTFLAPAAGQADWPRGRYLPERHHFRPGNSPFAPPQDACRSSRNNHWDHGPRPAGIIWHGIRSGRLSPREAQDLRDEAREIRWKEQRYLRDGYLSRFEREALRDDWEDFHDSIRHEMNDGERGWWR